MFAGSVTQLSRPRSAADRPPFAESVAPANSPWGGVIWITGVAGVARTGLVGLVRTLLEPSWRVDVLAPEQAQTWIERASEAAGRVAIVVANGSTDASAEERRADSDRAGLVFVQILVASDWDALVERTDSTLFEHLAAFFAHLGHAPSPRRSTTKPDAVVQLDWHSPHQIRKRLADALTRSGLLDRQQPSSNRHP